MWLNGRPNRITAPAGTIFRMDFTFLLIIMCIPPRAGALASPGGTGRDEGKRRLIYMKQIRF